MFYLTYSLHSMQMFYFIVMVSDYFILIHIFIEYVTTYLLDARNCRHLELSVSVLHKKTFLYWYLLWIKRITIFSILSKHMSDIFLKNMSFSSFFL